MDLTNFGIKNTKTRKKLLDIIKTSKDPITAEEAFLLFDKGETNLSTIYRTLHTFCDIGIIIKEIRPDGKALYSYAKKEHHHVLICIKCNKKIYLDNCPYKQITSDILNKTGFLLDNHNIELYGYCMDCQKK